MNIAVVVPGGLTEMLQATPLLRTLRAGDPAAHLVLICSHRAEPVASGVPAVDEVVALDGLDARPTSAGAVRLWWQLRRRRLEAVLVCSQRGPARVAAFLSGVAERLGPGGGLSSVLLSAQTTADPHENRAAVWLRLASLAGIRQELHAPAYEPGPEAVREADRILHNAGLADGRLLVALAPGTGYTEADVPGSGDRLRWDGERYALLANQLSLRHGAGILFVGTLGDRATVDRILVDLRDHAVDLSGQLDVRVLGAVLSRCDLLVGGDSSLLHLAAAVGTPAVGLFGPTDGRRRGPYGTDHRIIQGLSQADGAEAQDPMGKIRVEDVLAGIEASL